VGYGKSVFDAYFKQRPDTKVDLAKAKQLIAGAGSVTKPMVLATSPDPSLVSVANALAAAGKTLGLDITVATLTPAENDQLYFDPKLRQKYDAFLNVQWTMAPDPLEELAFVTQGSFTNYGEYKNPQFESLFYEALGVENEDQRAEAVVKALRVVDEELPWIPVVSLPVTTFVRNDLTGIPTSWAFLYSGWATGLGGSGAQ
jgi:peptide/nickel transport system substrate-binding protein